jgi:protein SCO1/2
MRRWSVPLAGVALSLALVGAAACGGGSEEPPPHTGASHASPTGSLVAHEYDPPRAIPDFTLTDQDGEPFRFSDTDGTVRLLYFGYTNCPDICPTTLLTWKQVREELGDHADHVTFIMVTVDPEQDTPDVLKRYVKAFHPSFVGLTGSMEELTRVWAAFGVQVQKEPMPESAAGYSVGHTASVFAVDPEGRLRLKFPFGATPEQIASDVRRLME